MKRLLQKTLILAPILFITAIFCINTSVSAQTNPTQNTDTGYQLLAPIPTIEKAAGITLVDYMKGLFVASIGIAIILAVVQIVVGGIEYVAAAVPSSKEEARRRISGAVEGLLLILLAYVLLKALNPGLLNVGLNLENVVVFGGGNLTGTGSGAGAGSGGGNGNNGFTCEDVNSAKARISSGGKVCNNTGSCPSCDTSPWNASIQKYAALYNVPENAIRAVIARESSCRVNPGSVDGKSCGLMQVTGNCSLDPDTNINQGTKKLAQAYASAGVLKLQYGNSVTVDELAAAIYNGGSGESTPSADCTSSNGWATIPKWGCPINPGSATYNACSIRDYGCDVGSCM